MKRCCTCRLEKELSEFGRNKNKRDGLQPYCKRCVSASQKRWYSDRENKQRRRESRKRYRSDPKNAQRQRENARRWLSDPENARRNRENMKLWRSDPDNARRNRDNKKLWRSDPDNARRQRANQKRWYSISENVQRVRDNQKRYNNARLKTDPLFKLCKKLRSRLYTALKARSWTKNSHTRDIIGCSLQELLDHLGPVPTYDYHIDHICPTAQAQTEEEMYKLFHYTNLRYFPATDNISKKDSWTEEGERLCKALLGRSWIHNDTSENR